jgi:Phospholipase_D-nuclease N-terminal
MTLALSEDDFPLQDLFWTTLLVFGWVLFFYLLFVVFRDLFGRDDVSAWGKTAWTLLVLVLPVIGSLIYLASQSARMGERELRRTGATHLRMDAYERSVTGDGQYHGLRDEAARNRAMSGPSRPA